jgi:hypothetical protein
MLEAAMLSTQLVTLVSAAGVGNRSSLEEAVDAFVGVVGSCSAEGGSSLDDSMVELALWVHVIKDDDG